ncbi:MAG: ribonuclease P protein component [Candidatus Gracilibacteria bacterium]|nr:ribonuclease P protein component [Candidatus Gracilibacteria bacterium]
MIPKLNRLTEKEVKKVLTRGKPFFSYGIVLNYQKNNLEKNRFAIVIGGKSVKTSVERNFFRRSFYDLVRNSINFLPFSKGAPGRKYSWGVPEGGGIKDNNTNKSYDFVFVVKKQTKLDKNDENIINSFKKDIKFLLSKI